MRSELGGAQRRSACREETIATLLLNIASSVKIIYSVFTKTFWSRGVACTQRQHRTAGWYGARKTLRAATFES